MKEFKVSVFVGVPLLLEGMHKKIMQEVEKQGKTKLIKLMQKLTGGLRKVGIDVRRKVFKTIIDSLGNLTPITLLTSFNNGMSPPETMPPQSGFVKTSFL